MLDGFKVKSCLPYAVYISNDSAVCGLTGHQPIDDVSGGSSRSLWTVTDSGMCHSSAACNQYSQQDGSVCLPDCTGLKIALPVQECMGDRALHVDEEGGGPRCHANPTHPPTHPLSNQCYDAPAHFSEFHCVPRHPHPRLSDFIFQI